MQREADDRSKAGGGRSWLTCALLGALLVWTTPAAAEWKHARNITHGTAQVLERGEINFGVLSPIAYGMRDWLTVQTHPVFDLLLKLNLSARARLVESRLGAVSIALGYKQGFLSEETSHLPGEHVGEMQAGLMGSVFLADRVVLTGAGLWAPNVVRGLRAGDYDVASGVAAIATVHLLGTSRDLFMGTVYLRYDFPGAEFDTPLGTFAWIHDVEKFDSLHVVLGLSVGRFGVRSLTGSAGTEPTELYAWPVFDLWWRL